jgi:hypothetical protein
MPKNSAVTSERCVSVRDANAGLFRVMASYGAFAVINKRTGRKMVRYLLGRFLMDIVAIRCNIWMLGSAFEIRYQSPAPVVFVQTILRVKIERTLWNGVVVIILNFEFPECMDINLCNRRCLSVQWICTIMELTCVLVGASSGSGSGRNEI